MFYFYIPRYCPASERCKIHIDLNPLDACTAEKQQSDKKLSIIENKQSLIMRWQLRKVRSSVE